jgi:hypothetical protein
MLCVFYSIWNLFVKYFKMLILANFLDLFFQFDLYADRLMREYIRYTIFWLEKVWPGVSVVVFEVIVELHRFTVLRKDFVILRK